MFDFECQRACLADLKVFAGNDAHSVIISGIHGCGKTAMARRYSRMLGISDFAECAAKVDEIRGDLSQCMGLKNKILLCIENVDDGVGACAHILLKSMEEPSGNVYIVLTCRDPSNIPDTLVSRSMQTSVAPPTDVDIKSYFTSKYPDAFDRIAGSALHRCVSSFPDVDEVAEFTDDQIRYFRNFDDLRMFKGPVSDASWRMQHFDDNVEVSPHLIVKCIMSANAGSPHIVSSCLECLDELDARRLPKFMPLSKLAFDLKYTG